MVVFVQGSPVQLLPGMQVRHALEAAGLLAEVERGACVRDEWGNELGLDGALREGMVLRVQMP